MNVCVKMKKLADVHPDQVQDYLAAGWVHCDDFQGIDDVVAAIGALDASDSSHWTRNGLPSIQVLAKKLGRTIKSSERDAAFKQFNAQKS